MGNFLLIVVIGLAVWWMWRKLQAAKSRAVPEKPERPAELMVRCALCGVNQPKSECVQSRVSGALYCSEAHRRDAESHVGGS